MQGVAVMSQVWQTLIGTLSLRLPPTLDEIKDLKRSEGNSRRLAALRDAKAAESARKIAGTENRMMQLVTDRPGITFQELAERMRITTAHTRVVAHRLEADGRLRHETGKLGLKKWFLK